MLVAISVFLKLGKICLGLFLHTFQTLSKACFLCCWLGYSLYVFLAPPGSVVMFSLYLPVLVPLLLLPPALASLHWSTSLAPLYDSYHAHPDMEDTRTREKTFPPDWGHISGSQLAPKHMADAGKVVKWTCLSAH